MGFKDWLFGTDEELTAQEILDECEEDEKAKIKTYIPKETEEAEETTEVRETEEKEVNQDDKLKR